MLKFVDYTSPEGNPVRCGYRVEDKVKRVLILEVCPITPVMESLLTVLDSKGVRFPLSGHRTKGDQSISKLWVPLGQTLKACGYEAPPPSYCQPLEFLQKQNMLVRGRLVVCVPIDDFLLHIGAYCEPLIQEARKCYVDWLYMTNPWLEDQMMRHEQEVNTWAAKYLASGL